LRKKTLRNTTTYSIKDERFFFATLLTKFRKNNGICLDVGCGYGFFTNLLGEMGYDISGVDLDTERILEAHKRYAASFLVGDARHPPFMRNAFDLVLCRGLSTLSSQDLAIEASAQQRDALMDLLTRGGLLVFISASNLTGEKTSIQNHKLPEVSTFFAKSSYRVSTFFFFAQRHVLKLLRRFAFSSVITKASSLLTQITRRAGYIVCIVEKNQ
jgi:SAM-dependent methyltransferase